VSLAFAAASLIGFAGFVPAQAQNTYTGTTTPAYTQSSYPAQTTNPGYPGEANGGYGLPYPGPQAATPAQQSTYPSARPDYTGGNSAAAPQAETGYQPANVPPPGYGAPGAANGGYGLPYPGPQAATPGQQSTYPSARPGYTGGNSSAEPQAATGYQPAMQPQPRTEYQPRERTQMVTNGPQANIENESPGWSARQNVINSHRYERLIATDQAFRNARMRKECGPITDPQLHASCIASFENRG
jgi:hypothetical protein